MENEMAKLSARATQIIFENDDYFVAHLDNGGVRVGMFEVCCVDFPAHHEIYAEAVALTPETVEAFCDRQVEEGRFCVVG